jgi:hypothetical protein
MKKIAGALVKRYLPRQWYRFTPVASPEYAVSPAQVAILQQYGIHHLELHILDGLRGPVQETFWDSHRAEDYNFERDTPLDRFFLRKKSTGYELRLGPAYALQSPDEVARWIDAFLSTAVSRIEWLGRRSTALPRPRTRHLG